jgi:cytochrome o ubiquinol oxidase operon protein cyoD
MSEAFDNPSDQNLEIAPGDELLDGTGIAQGIRGYVIGLLLAAALTAASFFFVHAGGVWSPAVPVALVVLAVAQMGVHLVFFIHITTAPDSTNNVLALAFGVFIVVLVIAGSLWIMASMHHNMVPTMSMNM